MERLPSSDVVKSQITIQRNKLLEGRLIAVENELYTVQGYFAQRGQPCMMSPNTHEQARGYTQNPSLQS